MLSLISVFIFAREVRTKHIKCITITSTLKNLELILARI